MAVVCMLNNTYTEELAMQARTNSSIFGEWLQIENLTHDATCDVLTKDAAIAYEVFFRDE